MEHAFAVILAGGKGERFWPLSTAAKPKQLLALTGDRTLIELSADRVSSLIPKERIMIITNRDLVSAVREAVPDMPAENIVGEPVGRDTAAAVALAAAMVEARDPEGVFCILTADHIIEDEAAFHRVLTAAFGLAQTEDTLITIGIRPTEPSVGFGYIEACTTAVERDGIRFLKAERFREKPDRETARKYISSGNFYWNSGMFIWSVKTLRREFTTHAPNLAELTEQCAAARPGTSGFDQRLEPIYEPLEKISIDYALMEKSENILMASAEFGWDDVGSWPALRNHFPENDDHNVIIGSCETLDSELNIVHSKDRLTALIGVKGLMVVQAENATLICAEEQAADIKKLVARLREKGEYDHVL